MTVAVTGASGVVGSAIVQMLSGKNIKTRSVVRSTANPGLLAPLRDVTELVDQVESNA